MTELIIAVAIVGVIFVLLTWVATWVAKWQHIKYGVNRHGTTADWYSQLPPEHQRTIIEEQQRLLEGDE